MNSFKISLQRHRKLVKRLCVRHCARAARNGPGLVYTCASLPLMCDVTGQQHILPCQFLAEMDDAHSCVSMTPFVAGFQAGEAV